MISICFRFDDPSATSDHDLERKILEIFAQRHVPLCVAAIPFTRASNREPVPLSGQNAAHLLEAERAGAIEIAQHGHSHLRRGANQRGVRSEFAGVPAVDQTRLIGEGRKHLATVLGHDVSGFVPPWNTYDQSTMQAVAAAGFEFLSAGPEVVPFGTLPVVPATCSLRDARRAAEGALFFRSLAPLLVVVFHPDDFEEFRFPPRPDEAPPFTNLRELEALLDWIQSTPHMRTEAISRIAKSVRGGTRLRSLDEMSLPYRVKARMPPMLTRSDPWTAMPGILWGALRSRYGAQV
jgi:peptidoglycan/xylan/chitin deacetylase (PgdA/CDA1 family)